MTVQELIDELMTVEDKNMQVIRQYDGWFFVINSPVITQLYADKDNKDITDWDEDLKKLTPFLLINPT